MVYYTLLTTSLYDLVNNIRFLAAGSPPDFNPDSPYWTVWIASLVLIVLLFPFANFKRIVVLLKINSSGVIFMVFVILFVIIRSFQHGLPINHLHSFPQFQPKFFYLVGMLILSFFIHNMVLPMMKNAREPKNNVRDLFIAFLLVTLSYLIVGVLAYVSYFQIGTSDPNGGLPQNFLQLFTQGDKYAFAARVSLFLQLSMVFPVLCFVFRIQFFGLVWKNVYPGVPHVIALNAIVFAASILIAVFYPHIGDILRFVGATAGYIYVFAFPIFINLVHKYRTKTLAVLNAIPDILIVLFGTVTLVWQFIPTNVVI
jgi:sodium-coupled neutral amino acid transporter 9